MCSACLVQKNKGLKVITLFDYEYKDGNEKKVKYSIRVPKEGYQDMLIISGSHELENRAIYQDSSIIYITNDANGSALNYDNIQSISDKVQTGKLFVDTLFLEGLTESNFLWKEIKLTEICVGYVNVPPDKKESYDKALASITRK